MTTTAPETNGVPAPKPEAPAAPLATIPAGEGALNSFADERSFATGQRMAKALCASSLVPEDYRGPENIANCMIAIELASRIGASVFMVMQNLDIIHGRPGWRASFLIATVNACGRFTPLRFRWEGTPGKDDWGCRAYAKDRRGGDECLGTLITLAMAKAEGWSSKNGSKWKTMPEQMLCYRAAAFWTRVYAPELSLGIQTAEEVQDFTIDMPSERHRPMSRGSAADLEERLRETLTAPTPEPAPTVQAPPAPPTPKPETKTATPAAASSGPPCTVCKKPVGDDAVSTQGGLRHPDCGPFGIPVTRQPGED